MTHRPAIPDDADQGNRLQWPDGPLVAAAWVEGNAAQPWMRIVDARWSLTDPGAGRRAYGEAHIPGAAFLDLETDLTGDSGPGRHPLPEPDLLAERLGAIGIGNDHFVVVYDESSGAAAAARCWWLLKHLGHRHVALLDGGFASWRSTGRPVEQDVHEWPRAEFRVAVQDDDTIDGDSLLNRLEAITLIDARDADRYTGEREPIDPVGGHIPSAVNAPYAHNTDEHGRFKATDELRDQFAAIGADANAEVVVYCGSGVTACHTLVALAQSGIENARLYPGSWSDWCSSGGPIATGPEPGAKTTTPR
jgi:thiosulfate/3-mercaptopyruvate sulfurtransferase